MTFPARHAGVRQSGRALGAVTEKDPGFIKSHIWKNANGTYTVRLYQNGNPADVTVTSDLPTGRGVIGPAYAGTPGNVLWVMLYEKAYAQLNDGYSNIQSGFDTVLGDGTQDNHQLAAGHGYWVQSVDTTHNTITVVNPMNTGQMVGNYTMPQSR